jgi:hypothetical protein
MASPLALLLLLALLQGALGAKIYCGCTLAELKVRVPTSAAGCLSPSPLHARVSLKAPGPCPPGPWPLAPGPWPLAPAGRTRC